MVWRCSKHLVANSVVPESDNWIGLPSGSWNAASSPDVILNRWFRWFCHAPERVFPVATPECCQLLQPDKSNKVLDCVWLCCVMLRRAVHLKRTWYVHVFKGLARENTWFGHVGGRVVDRSAMLSCLLMTFCYSAGWRVNNWEQLLTTVHSTWQNMPLVAVRGQSLSNRSQTI